MLAGAGALLTCSEGPSGPTRRVTAVVTSRDSVYLDVADSVVLRAEARDVNGTTIGEASIVWRSPDPAVATVTTSGATARVAAVASGTVGVVASSGSHADTTLVTVLPRIVATTLAIHADTAWALGDAFVVGVTSRTATGARLGHYTVASRSSAVLAWFDDEAEAVRATAQLPGEAYVVVTERGGTADSALLVVRQRPVQVRITPDSLVGFLERSYRLTTSVRDARTNPIPGQTVTWVSFDSGIASVDPSGLVAFRALGTAHVAARHVGGAADTTPVTVLPKPKLSLSNLEIGQSHDSLEVGVRQLSYRFYAYAENAVSPWVYLRVADSGIAAVPDSVPYVGVGGTFSVRGKHAGRTLVIGEAPLMAPDTVRVLVSTPRLVLGDPLGAVPLAIRGTSDVRFGIWTTDSSGVRHPLADTLAVTFRSSDSTVIDLVQNRAPYVMPAGSGDNSTPVFAGDAVDTGRAVVSATASGYRPDSMTWQVIPSPTLRFWQGRLEVLGAGQTTAGVARHLLTLGPTTGADVSVTLTQRHPEVAVLPRTLTLTDVTGNGRIAGYTVDALVPGTDTVIATAAGYDPDTAIVVVTTPHILLLDTVRGTTLGGWTDVWAGDSLGARHAPTDALLLLATSSDTTIVRNSSTRIPARWLALWPLGFSAVDTGVATLTVRDSANRYVPERVTFTAVLDSSLHVTAFDGYQFGPAATQQRFEDSRFRLSHPEFPLPGRVVHLSTTVPDILRLPDSVIVTSPGYTFFLGAGGDIAGTTRIVATARGFRPDTSGPITVGRGHLKLQAPSTAFVGGAGYVAAVRALSPNGVDLPMDQSLGITLVPMDPGVVPKSTSTTVAAGQAVSASTALEFTEPGALRLAAEDRRPALGPFFGDTVLIDARLPPLRLTSPYSVPLTVGVGQRLASNISRPGEVRSQAVTVDVARRGSRSTSAPMVVVPAGATLAPYPIDGRAIGIDTVLLSAPGYAGDTVAVLVTEGRVALFVFPSALRTGDSLPAHIQVGDSALVRHAVVDATSFAIETSGGVIVSDGTRTITEIVVPAGADTAGPIYIKGTAPGAATVTLTNLYYAPAVFTTSVIAAPR